jgi:DNA-binding winged helix-turn-helix (wHTH) protein
MTIEDSPAPPRTEPFRLGDRTIFPRRNRIRGPSGEVHLEPRVMDVLGVLAAEDGNVLSRESLIARVWAVQYGGDESLTRAISILRKALGTAAIETIAKRGYRLAAPVEAADADIELAKPPAAAPVAAAASVPAAAPAPEPPLPARAYALRQQGRGPNRVFPAASLDFWRLPPIAFAIALAMALGIAAADVALFGS